MCLSVAALHSHTASALSPNPDASLEILKLQVGAHTSLIPALRRNRQAEFEAILVYIM